MGESQDSEEDITGKEQWKEVKGVGKNENSKGSPTNKETSIRKPATATNRYSVLGEEEEDEKEKKTAKNTGGKGRKKEAITKGKKHADAQAKREEENREEGSGDSRGEQTHNRDKKDAMRKEGTGNRENEKDAREERMDTGGNKQRKKGQDEQLLDQSEIEEVQYSNETRRKEQQPENASSTIQARIKKLQAKFSTEEKAFFRDAIDSGHINQTHFTDPSIDYCYRCPMCHRILNNESLQRKVRLHFGISHKDNYETYIVVINNKAESPIVIAPTSPGKYRDGAKPPNQEFIREFRREIQERKIKGKGKGGQKKGGKEESRDDKKNEIKEQITQNAEANQKQQEGERGPYYKKESKYKTKQKRSSRVQATKNEGMTRNLARRKKDYKKLYKWKKTPE